MREDATCAVAKREARVDFLPCSALPPKLPDRLDDEKDPEHARVCVGQPAAAGVECESTAWPQPTICDKGARLATLAAAKAMAISTSNRSLTRASARSGTAWLLTAPISKRQPSRGRRMVRAGAARRQSLKVCPAAADRWRRQELCRVLF